MSKHYPRNRSKSFIQVLSDAITWVLLRTGRWNVRFSRFSIKTMSQLHRWCFRKKGFSLWKPIGILLGLAYSAAFIYFGTVTWLVSIASQSLCAVFFGLQVNLNVSPADNRIVRYEQIVKPDKSTSAKTNTVPAPPPIQREPVRSEHYIADDELMDMMLDEDRDLKNVMLMMPRLMENRMNRQLDEVREREEELDKQEEYMKLTEKALQVMERSVDVERKEAYHELKEKWDRLTSSNQPEAETDMERLRKEKLRQDIIGKRKQNERNY